MESRKKTNKKIMKPQRKRKLFSLETLKNNDAKQGGDMQENKEAARK
jgi:hypothetical protein